MELENEKLDFLDYQLCMEWKPFLITLLTNLTHMTFNDLRNFLHKTMKHMYPRKIKEDVAAKAAKNIRAFVSTHHCTLGHQYNFTRIIKLSNLLLVDWIIKTLST